MGVNLGPGTAIGGRGSVAEVLFGENDPPLLVKVKVEPVGDVPQVVELSIETLGKVTPRSAPLLRLAGVKPGSYEPAVITSDLLRALPLRELRDAVLARRRGGSGLDHLEEPRRVGRERKTHEHFEKVARLYREAVAAGRPPRQAIADAFDVEEATASKYVRQARELNLLGWPERPGVPGASAAASPIKRTSPKGSNRRTR